MGPAGTWTRTHLTAVTALALVATAACSADVKGPEPLVEPPSASAEPPPVDPEIICRDQLRSQVTLHGEGFSPVPIDVPDDVRVALPDVLLSRAHELDGGEVSAPDAVIWSGDLDADPTNAFDDDGEPLLSWVSQQEMAFIIHQSLTLGSGEGLEEGAERPTGVLEEGVWDVRVQNANDSFVDVPQSLAVVGRPEIADLTPGLTCLSQGARTITLDGTRYLRNEGDQVELEVETVGAPFPVTLSECTTIAHDGLDAEVCDRATVELGEGAVEVGWPALVLQNPETAACNTEEDIKLRVVPPPAIDRVVPPLGCVSDGARVFVIEGQDFLRVDGNDPLVSVGDMDFAVDSMNGCEALDTQGHDVERCDSITITIAQDALPPELYTVTVVNPEPAGCEDVASAALRIAPDPMIDDVAPPLVCVEDSDRLLEITGTGFLVVDGEVPAVTVDGDTLDPSVVAASGCSDLETPALDVQLCTSIMVTVAQGAVGLGRPDVQVENPQPAGCEDTRNDLLSVVDRPSLSEVAPGIVCLDEGARTLDFTGMTLVEHDGRMPVLHVDGVDDPFAATVSSCTDIDQINLDAALCTAANVELAQGSVPAGYHPLTFENPATAGCVSTDDIRLRVVEAPVIAQVVPSMRCVAEGAQGVVIEGTGFLRVDDVTPTLLVGTTQYAVDAMGGCEALETQGHTVEICTSMDITVDDTLAPDLYEVTVTNPPPAGCTGTATGALRIVPPPTVSAIAPPIVCVADGARDITITGTDFLTVDGAAPIVTVDGNTLADGSVVASGCTPLQVDGMTVEQCDTLVATVPQDGSSLGMPDVIVQNPAPAGCSDTRSDLLTVAPGPTITSAAPALVCTADGSKVISITGTGFLTVDATLPAVRIGGADVTSVDSVGGCGSPMDLGGLSVVECTSIDVTVAQDFLSEGQPEVVVENPAPVGCMAADSTVLTVPPTPAFSALAPPNVCAGVAGNLALQLQGQGFLRTSGGDFSVSFDGNPVTPDQITDCTELTVAGQTGVFTCNTIDLTVDLTGLTGTTGSLDVVLRTDNVASCDVTATTTLDVVNPPTVDLDCGPLSDQPCIDVVDADVDDNVCADTAITLVITGSDFADGATVTLSNSGQDIAADSVSVDSATQITATFSSGLPYELGDTAFTLVIDNGGGCASVPVPNAITVNPTPLVFFVDPPVVYNGITLDATIFTAGLNAISAIGTVELVDDSAVATALEVIDNPKPNRIVARIPGDDPNTAMPTFDPGQYDVHVTSTLGCQSEIAGSVTVTETLNNTLLSGIDPSFVSPTESTAVTVSGSGFAPLPRLYLTPSSGEGAAVALRSVEIQASDSISAVIPASPEDPLAGEAVSLTATGGSYPTGYVGGETLDIEIDSAPFTVTFAITDQTLADVIAAINAEVGVDVASDDGGQLRLDSQQNGAGSQVAVTGGTGASVLGFTGSEEVTPGDVVYDLVLVAPNNEVAVLPMAVTAVIAEPPLVTSVAPATFDANTAGQGATIFGADFFPDPNDVGVSLDCQDFATGTSVGASGSVTVDTATETELAVTLDTGGIDAGSVCVVIVTNADGASYRFSAISVKEPAQNLNPWASTPAMQDGRRALGLEAGRPTDTSRQLYAIGGDSGVTNDHEAIGTVLSSVESISVGVFGEMGAWTYQRNDLSSASVGGSPTASPRSWAGSTRVGRFLYMVGGHDGSSATDTTLRAQILDPLAAPEISELDAQLGDGVSGLSGGIYYYRIAALFPDNDPSNPGGESLAGELLPVQIPDLSGGIILSLAFQEVPGASGYRVYRTPAADDTPDQMQLLAELTCGDPGCDCTADGSGQLSLCPLEDDGTVSTDDTVTPMPPGSTGVWHAVDGSRCSDANCDLGTAREAHATVAVRDPSNPDRWFLYAAGGRDSGGSVVSSIEYATITVGAGGAQSVADWQTATASLGTARAELAGFVVRDVDTNVLASGQVYVYFGQGRTDSGLSSAFEAGLVGANGDFASLTGVSGPTPTRVGTTDLSANGWLFVMGGANGNPSSGNDSSSEVSGSPPALSGWDALGGGAMLESRIYMGSAKESAFFFIAGGHDGTSALSSTEQTIQ